MEINNHSFIYEAIASELIITIQEWDPAVTTDNAMKTAQFKLKKSSISNY